MCGGWTEQAETLGTEAEGYVEGMPSLGGDLLLEAETFRPDIISPISFVSFEGGMGRTG